MSPLIQTLLLNFTLVMASMLVLWIISIFWRDASIVDQFWGTGFAIVSGASWWLNAPASVRVSLLVGLTSAWGMRLTLYVMCRNWGQGEDRRYAAMRERNRRRFWWVSLFTVFLLQAAILWFVSLPIQAAASINASRPLHFIDAIGVVIWTVGFFFETVGDWQLARFKADPANKGRVMDQGLWRYTRHPNYFGDFCVWWGLYMIAAAGGAWWSVLSPVMMSWLLLKVSGVALLEKTITDRRPEYAKYQSRTNAFFPGPPRKPAHI